MFTSETGAPIHVSCLLDHFKSVLNRIGLPAIRFHDLGEASPISTGDNRCAPRHGFQHRVAVALLEPRGDDARSFLVQGLELVASDAADVSQTTWLRLAEHLNRIREPERLHVMQ